jgi:hypothetical protein
VASHGILGRALARLGDTGGRYCRLWHLRGNVWRSPLAAPMPPGLSWSSPTCLCTPEIAAPSPPGGRWLSISLHAAMQPCSIAARARPQAAAAATPAYSIRIRQLYRPRDTVASWPTGSQPCSSSQRRSTLCLWRLRWLETPAARAAAAPGLAMIAAQAGQQAGAVAFT